MRLSEVLSKPPDTKFVQVDGFMNKPLSVGKQRQIDIGQIGLNFYCKSCNDSGWRLLREQLYNDWRKLKIFANVAKIQYNE
jgi:hypothetical protein